MATEISVMMEPCRPLLSLGVLTDEFDNRELIEVNVFLLSARILWAPTSGWRRLPSQGSAFFVGPEEFAHAR